MLGLENLVFAIFEFVHAIVDGPKFRSAVKTGLADLMYYIVLYMQITDSQVIFPFSGYFKFSFSFTFFM